MLLKWLPFIIFTIVFLLLANWHVFITTLTGLSKPKAPYSKLEGQDLTDYIKNKTGIQISTFYLVNSDLLFGGMTGIPARPIMTISKGVYDSFSPEELNYVLLHETGHCALFHSVKELLIQGIVVIIAFLVFRSFRYSLSVTITIALVSAIVLGIVLIQIMRSFERQADAYALQHLDNPQAMIDATKKLEAAWGGPPDDSINRILFYRGIPYSERIRHAENYSK